MIASLKQIINELKTEIHDKTNYIDRLKQDKQTLLEEAESSEDPREDQLVQENNDIKQKLAQLTQQSLKQNTNASKNLASPSTQTSTKKNPLSR
ncbi:unnamed protein product [Ceutorhynchus assimilis]|uniref:Uncharacterized protein n=1 Tax=Ceutorhynchus assimilis TaxID=467358 RepID=A0A9N9QIA5_9CUCU|nr:unnamed protein product [Ceutorhynchus assimilis]